MAEPAAVRSFKDPIGFVNQIGFWCDCSLPGVLKMPSAGPRPTGKSVLERQTSGNYGYRRTFQTVRANSTFTRSFTI